MVITSPPIVGLTYKKDKYSVNTVLSYTKNHMSDDEGTYFDAIGAELYIHYDIDDSFQLCRRWKLACFQKQ